MSSSPSGPARPLDPFCPDTTIGHVNPATRLVVLVFLISTACRREPAGPVHFAREEVELNVRPGTLEVTGTYHLNCESEAPIAGVILYPFPIDKAHAFPESVDIRGSRFAASDTAVTFTMRFRPGEEDSFIAWYRQPLRGGAARYIVTSTRKWNRPIDTARFRVTVPFDLPDARLNYRPDSITRTDSTLTWHFTRRRFWPSEDIIVTWRHLDQ